VKILENRVVSLFTATLFILGLGIPTVASHEKFTDLSNATLAGSYQYGTNGMVIHQYDEINNSLTVFKDGRRHQEMLGEGATAVTLNYEYEDGKLVRGVHANGDVDYYESGRRTHTDSSFWVSEPTELPEGFVLDHDAQTNQHIYTSEEHDYNYVEATGECGSRVWVRTDNEPAEFTTEGHETEHYLWIPDEGLSGVEIIDDNYVFEIDWDESAVNNGDVLLTREDRLIVETTAEYEYNDMGQLVRIVDPRYEDEDFAEQGVQYYEYDGHSRIGQKSYNRQLEKWVYTSFENDRAQETVVAETDPEGNIQIEEDSETELEAGRVVSMNYWSGSRLLATIQFDAYSEGKNPVSITLYDKYGRQSAQYSYRTEDGEYVLPDENVLEDLGQRLKDGDISYEDFEEETLKHLNLDESVVMLQNEWVYDGALLRERRNYPDGALAAGEDGAEWSVHLYDEFENERERYTVVNNDENSLNPPDPGLETPPAEYLTTPGQDLVNIMLAGVTGYTLGGTAGAAVGIGLALVEAGTNVISRTIDDLLDGVGNMIGGGDGFLSGIFG